MEEIKSIIAKLAIGKKISEQDIKRLILGKNSAFIDKITKHLDQTTDIAKAIKTEPKILQELIKSKAISEMFKYSKKKGNLKDGE